MYMYAVQHQQHSFSSLLFPASPRLHEHVETLLTNSGARINDVCPLLAAYTLLTTWFHALHRAQTTSSSAAQSKSTRIAEHEIIITSNLSIDDVITVSSPRQPRIPSRKKQRQKTRTWFIQAPNQVISFPPRVVGMTHIPMQEPAKTEEIESE